MELAVILSAFHRNASCFSQFGNGYQLIASFPKSRNDSLGCGSALLIDGMHEDDVSVFHVGKNNIYRIVGVLGLPIQCIDTPEDGRLS